MAQAAKEAVRQKAALLTVHTLSGPTALKAVAGVTRGTKTKALGVTLLTSICGHFLKDLGVKRKLSAEVLYLAKMAKRSGLDGVVCSVAEAKLLRRHLGNKFLIVTPGIRLRCQDKADQMRVATPEEAYRAGADYIVVGRPILAAKSPLSVVKEILK
jgi:orotidine-5'-phosphate decarboxylase